MAKRLLSELSGSEASDLYWMEIRPGEPSKVTTHSMLVVMKVANEMWRPGPGSGESSIRVWGQGCCRAAAGHRAKVVFLPNLCSALRAPLHHRHADPCHSLYLISNTSHKDELCSTSCNALGLAK